MAEFTSEGDERFQILVHPCIGKMDRIGMGVKREFCAAEPWESGRHACGKFRRAITMKILVDLNKAT